MPEEGSKYIVKACSINPLLYKSDNLFFQSRLSSGFRAVFQRPTGAPLSCLLRKQEAQLSTGRSPTAFSISNSNLEIALNLQRDLQKIIPCLAPPDKRNINVL
jgi:hypothetical protein